MVRVEELILACRGANCISVCCRNVKLTLANDYIVLLMISYDK